MQESRRHGERTILYPDNGMAKRQRRDRETLFIFAPFLAKRAGFERRSRCLLGDGVGLIFVFLSFCFHIPKIFIHDFKTNRFIETYCWHIRNTNRDAYAVHRGMFSATYIQVECLL